MAEGIDGVLDRVGLTRDIVSAFVSNNSLSPLDLPALIVAVHAMLNRLSAPEVVEAPEQLTPAVSIRKSVSADYLICLEDGKRFKSLKRHLRSKYNMTPDEYRTRWNLPDDYPMVAPNYAAERSHLAKAMGLGHQRRATTAKT